LSPVRFFSINSAMMLDHARSPGRVKSRARDTNQRIAVQLPAEPIRPRVARRPTDAIPLIVPVKIQLHATRHHAPQAPPPQPRAGHSRPQGGGVEIRLQPQPRPRAYFTTTRRGLMGARCPMIGQRTGARKELQSGLKFATRAKRCHAHKPRHPARPAPRRARG